MQTLLLDRDDVAAGAEMSEVIDAVRAAFAAYDRGDVQMPAKSYVELDRYDGDFRSMPAYLDAGDWDAAGVKWVNVHLNNPRDHDLPTVMGTLIYSDPETAFPLAILDGTEITLQRTGAAAAVATDELAVPEASSLGIVGAGVQSSAQLEAIAAVRPIETVVVSDVDEAAVAAFVEAFEDRFDVRGGTVEEAAACDVLSTVTPAREPIVPRAALGEYTHVNAIGADAAGKREHELETLRDAKLVIDDYEQCTHSGEVNVPWSAGVRASEASAGSSDERSESDGGIGDDDLHAELGAIVTGRAEGRTAEDGITLFDSTGLAIQDVAAARVVYERARSAGEGTEFDLLGLA